jgi:3-oxoacid CoA-transferase subunit A
MYKFYIMADLHGDIYAVDDLACRLAEKGTPLDATDTLIILGDLGINYYGQNSTSERYRKLHLDNIGCTIFAIRGNHERRPEDLYEESFQEYKESCGEIPMSWSTTKAFGGSVYYEKKYPHILYAIDEPAVYTFNGYRVLTLPGAYSVDKPYRLKMGFHWFPNEQMTEDEREWAVELCEMNSWKFDFIMSHTCPTPVMPKDLFIEGVEDADTTTEEFMQSLVDDELQFKTWLFGHMHDYRTIVDDRGNDYILVYNDRAIELDDVASYFVEDLPKY